VKPNPFEILTVAALAACVLTVVLILSKFWWIP
jgi:uncharacterized OsmC-like protein